MYLERCSFLIEFQGNGIHRGEKQDGWCCVPKETSRSIIEGLWSCVTYWQSSHQWLPSYLCNSKYHGFLIVSFEHYHNVSCYHGSLVSIMAHDVMIPFEHYHNVSCCHGFLVSIMAHDVMVSFEHYHIVILQYLFSIEDQV